MAIHDFSDSIYPTFDKRLDKVIHISQTTQMRAQLKGKRRYSDEYGWGKVSGTAGGQWAGGDAQVSDNSGNHDYRDRWLDERFARLDDKLDHHTRLVDERLGSYGAKIDQFLDEMRSRDHQRHTETVSIQQTLASLQASNRQITMAIIIGFVSVAAAVLIGLLVPHFFGGG